MPGTRRLVLLFALTVFLPGLVLAAFGVRALLQERQVAVQQWQQRLDLAASAAANALVRQIDEWTAAIADVSPGDDPDSQSWPLALRGAIEEPGVAAVRIETPEGIEVWPESAAAYRSWAPPRQSVLPPSLVVAEGIELSGNPAGAVERYRELLAAARGDDRAWLLHRIARALRKAGRPEEATRSLDDLEQLRGSRVGGLPADFLAAYTRTTVQPGDADSPTALLRALHAGRWVLEESRYQFYVSQLRDLAAGNGASPKELGHLDDLRARREALTAAVLGTNDGEPGEAFLMLRGAATKDRTITPALVVNRAWLTQQLESAVLPPATTPALAVAVREGRDPARFEHPSSDLHASRAVSAGGLLWELDVRPEDPSAAFDDVRRWQRGYLAMLVGVVALLGFGAYLTTRVVRRELEIARIKSDFVSAVSHEFRSPLTAVRQLSEMLSRGRVPSEAKRQEYYKRILHESGRLSRVVENLLDFARMEEGRHPYHFEPTDTGEWARSIVSTFESSGRQRSHRIVSDIADELPPVAIDREALATVVDNLLDNAIKYSPDADVVWFDVGAEPGGVVIAVRDQGVGIAAADRSHVFERFYRGTTPAVASVPGTGLGLSLVHRIVQDHGGRVEVESEAGAGTTVSVHLKAVP